MNGIQQLAHGIKSVEVKKIESEIIKMNVAEHKFYKTELLNLIDEMPNNPFQWVSKSDWDLPKSFARKYLDLFYKKVIRTSMKKLQDYYKADDWNISNGWFQQYEKDSYHQWHNHEGANFTNVYFLELPDSKFRTKIKVGDEIVEYEAEEGDLISFPAYLLHTSEKNGDGRKTVIAFNSNFKYIDKL